MSEPFLGQITVTSWTGLVPRGYATCDGQLLTINQNLALFSLLGTMYGGNGSTTFALPDLRGRVPASTGTPQFPVGMSFGSPTVTLTRDELPPHIHFARGSSAAANASTPANKVLAGNAINTYGPPSEATPLHPDSIAVAGGSQPHQNMQPWLAIQFMIAIQGTFPSRN